MAIPTDNKLLDDLKSRFLRAFNAEVSARKEDSLESERFYDGDQWTPEELQIFEERKQPPVTVNRCKPKVDALVGMGLKLKVDTKAIERKTRSFKAAKHITAGFKYVEQTNEFDKTESRVFKDGCVKGKGWYKITKELQGVDWKIIINRVNPHNIFRDPASRNDDLSDCKDLHESIWMDLDDAKLMWPQFEKELEDAVTIKDSQEEDVIGFSKEDKPDQYRQPDDETHPNELADVFVDVKKKQVRVTSTW